MRVVESDLKKQIRELNGSLPDGAPEYVLLNGAPATHGNARVRALGKKTGVGNAHQLLTDYMSCRELYRYIDGMLDGITLWERLREEGLQ